MATERKDILFDGNGKYVEGQFTIERGEYWPIAEGEEPTAAHLDDLRLLDFLTQHPGAGYYPEPYDEDPFDPTDGQASYAQNVIDDADFPNKIAIGYDETILWGEAGHVRKWICIAYDKHETAPASGDFRYGLNNLHVYGPGNNWDAYKPPDHINPSLDVSETHNNYWVLAPNFNYYSEVNKYSPVYEAVQDRPAGTVATYLYLAHTKERLPELVNPLMTHDGQGNNSRDGKSKNSVTYQSDRLPNKAVEGDLTHFYHPMKEIQRRHITQIESLGTAHTPNWEGKNVSGHSATSYILTGGQADGNFPNGDPMNPVYDSSHSETTYPQFLFEPKLCAAHQNQLVFLLEMLGGVIALPVDNDYKKNFIEKQQWDLTESLAEFEDQGFGSGWFYQGEGGPTSETPAEIKYFSGGEWHAYRCISPLRYYYPDGNGFEPGEWELIDITEWDPLQYEDQENYAVINEPYWACNESGFECMLKYTGNYDLWFDTENVYMPQYILFEKHDLMDVDEFHKNEHLEQTGPHVYRDDFIEQEKNTCYPKACGTWRRCFRYCFGRIDQREARDYSNDTNGIDQHALTKTLMRPNSFGEPIPEGEPWKQMQATDTHWFGNHDDHSTKGPGEWYAEFELDTNPIPWPGIWDGDEKTELWVGHNWDGTDLRQTHLDYFDANGETYDQYDPAPDDDGRPVFDYEELKVKVEAETATGEEITKYNAFNAMFTRHDPTQIVDETAHYEIQADMLNDMREMLLYSRTQIVTLPEGIHEIYGYAAGTEEDGYSDASSSAYMSYLYGQISAGAAGYGWVDSDAEGMHETIIGEGIGWYFNDPNYVVDELDDHFRFIDNIPSAVLGDIDWTICWRAKQRYKISGVKELGLITTSAVRIKISYWSYNSFYTQCSWNLAGGEPNAHDCKFKLFTGEAEILGNNEITIPKSPFVGAPNPVIHKTYIDFPVSALEDLGGNEFLIIGAKITNSTIVPDGADNLSTAYTEGHIQFETEMQVVATFDWNEILDSVVDTPNQKGLKQREDVS